MRNYFKNTQSLRPDQGEIWRRKKRNAEVKLIKRGDKFLPFAGRIQTVKERGLKEPACKPGSVLNSHSSRLQVALQLKQSTQEPRGPHVRSSI
jgi:hypothetical protein